MLGFASPSHTNNDNNTPVTTATTPDPGPETGGDGGHIPPKKP
ncbi:hypothetical protein [Pedobacter gandavensis]|nr:hypothetical protein [Pedobacter gandavensis]